MNAPENTEASEKTREQKLGSRQRGTETMFRTSYRTHLDLTTLADIKADIKANIMISINGLILSVVIVGVGPRLDTDVWLFIPASVLLVVCLISMVFSILSARPRVKRRRITLSEMRANRGNFLFFGNFANMTEEEYVDGMVELLQNGDRIYYNMIRDMYGLGRVLLRKYQMLRYAYTVFMIGLIFSVLLFLFFFVLASQSTVVTPLP